MNIEDLKDSELITELYERMTAPKESNIDRMIREAFERIDNIIDLACDDLDELKLDYASPSFFKSRAATGGLSSGQDQRLALAAQQQMSGFGSVCNNLAQLGGLGIGGALGLAGSFGNVR